MVYLDFDRRKGRLSNPLLFVFWFLLFISGIIILRTKILRAIGFEKVCPCFNFQWLIKYIFNFVFLCSETPMIYSAYSPMKYGFR